MANIMIAPGKYIQGKGELGNLAKHMQHLGEKFLLLTSKSGLARVKVPIEASFKGTDKKYEFGCFDGECSKKEIDKLIALATEKKCDVIVGIGGGKLIDTAKAVAYYKKAPVVIVPTIASTDAPCSALSVLYTDDGVFSEYLVLPHNPEVVLLDTQIIAQAPARLLVAGMGDALATYFEARAVKEAEKTTMAGGKPTLAAMALSELCYKTLLEEGFKAKVAMERGVCTKAVEHIIEANTFLSGLGFESGGLAAAHAIHNGLTVLKECHDRYHGEKVAFGVLTQLILEDAPMELLDEVITFCQSVGLPVSLRGLGVKKINNNLIKKVAELACAEGETIYNMPFAVTVDDVYAAILAADAMGEFFS